MSNFSPTISVINKFCENFKELFSNTQFVIFRSFIYALINEYKRLNLSTLAGYLNLNYDKLQYFFSDSQWDYKELNDKRIDLLRNQRTTGFSEQGSLVIDDTGVLKPYAPKTEGVKYQYCPVLKKEALCNIGVASCFTTNNRHIPLDVKFYKTQDEFILGKEDPEFKSKLSLAKELIEDAASKQIPFKYILFDSWYASRDMLDFIHNKNLSFITEIKSDRRVYLRNPSMQKSYFMQQDELVKLIRKHLWHKVRILSHNGQLLYVYSFTTRLSKTHFPVRAFVVMGRLSLKDNRDVRIIISNDLSLSFKDALPSYFNRWAIERLFRELKDSLFFDHYQVRHKLKIMRYWMLVILAWSLLYWIKQNGYLYRTISVSLKDSSISQCKQVLLKLIIFSSCLTLTKNDIISVTKKPKKKFIT